MKTNFDKIFIVTRTYISASDNSSNNRHDCEAFKTKEKAKQLFDKWRNEELELRQETGCDYEIRTDNEQAFRCSWDNGEMLIITLAANNIID